MNTKPRYVLPDKECPELRTAKYTSLLKSTSWMLIKIIEASLLPPPNAPFDQKSSIDAMRRAMISLTQLPSEWSGVDKRFDNARWRSGNVVPGEVQVIHGEHPWSKSRTKKLVIRLVTQAIHNKIDMSLLIEPVSTILDIRTDTVLLPSSDLPKQGIILETRADGLLGRYGPAILNGSLQLFDRHSGEKVSYESLQCLEAERNALLERTIADLDIPVML